MKYSVYSVMTPDLTPQELVPLVEEYGYDGVEWRLKETSEYMQKEKPSFWRNNLCTLDPDSSADQLDEWLALTQEKGIKVVCLMPYLTCGDLEGTQRVLHLAQKLGATMFRVGIPWYDRKTNYLELFDQAVHYLSEVEEMCKQYGVKGLVETHHDTIACSAGLTHRLVQSFDPDYIGVLYDPGNMVHEGYENYRLGLELLGPYVAHVHAKNAVWQAKERRKDAIIKWEATWSLIDEGIVDWKQVLLDLKETGYKGYIGIEDFSGKLHSKEALKYNLEWIKKWVNEAL